MIEFGSSSSNLPEQHDEVPQTSPASASSSRNRHVSQEKEKR